MARKKPYRERYSELMKSDALRSPRWRYDRASALANANPPVNSSWYHDDDDIRALRGFLLSSKRLSATPAKGLGGRQESLRPLMLDFPDLYFAHEMFLRGRRSKTEIEARILAGQSDQEIAFCVQCRPETVDWYERAFFHTRDRLHNRGYICNQVLFQSLTGDEEAWEQEVSAKFFAYFGGPHVFAAVWHYCREGLPIPDDPANIRDFQTEFIDSALRQKMANAANSLVVNRYNVMDLFALHAKFKELASSVKTESADMTIIERSVLYLLSSMPWVSGDARQELLEKSKLRLYHGHSAELRAGEMNRLSTVEGEVIDLDQTNPFDRPAGNIEHANPA